MTRHERRFLRGLIIGFDLSRSLSPFFSLYFFFFVVVVVVLMEIYLSYNYNRHLLFKYSVSLHMYYLESGFHLFIV